MEQRHPALRSSGSDSPCERHPAVVMDGVMRASHGIRSLVANDRGASIMIKIVTRRARVLLFVTRRRSAQTIYPIDRAEILAGAKFDFKVEFPGTVDPAQTEGDRQRRGLSPPRSAEPRTFIEREDGKDQSALLLRDVDADQARRVHGRGQRRHAAAAA